MIYRGGNDSLLPSSMTARSDDEDKYRDGDDRAFRGALASTLQTVALSLSFGAGVFVWKGSEAGMEYLAGYIVEQSLSVDNLFVFIMLFDYFKVPLPYQHRVLTWGIIGAVVMRGGMIYAGVAAMEQFEWIMLIFAGILLISAFKLLSGGDDDDEEDLANNCVMRMTSMILPATTEYDGDRFFIRERGRIFATPLFMCLVCIEFSDLIFAIDSIPAVIGISKDPLIVYFSNIFAIMGLRSLYTVLAKAVTDLPYLKPAVALILGFVGGKMIGRQHSHHPSSTHKLIAGDYFSYTLSTALSLVVVVALISAGVLLSFLDKRTKKSAANGSDNSNSVLPY